jgi:thiol-disulfide isomerase/thioredoxin
MPPLPRRALLLASPAWAFPSGGPGAPRFHAKTLDGTRLDNAALLGKVVLIQFWATWCGYCRRDQPFVDEAVEAYNETKLAVLAVNSGESRAKVRDYLARSPRLGHMVLAADTNLPTLFRSPGLPHYVVIDRAGRLVKEQTGAGGARGLAQLLVAAGLR